MTYALGYAITVYVAIGFAWCSYIMGYEDAAPPREDMRTRWFDLLALVALWPVVLLAGVIADILGGT